MRLLTDPRFFLFVATTLLIYWRIATNDRARLAVLWVASLGLLAYLHPVFAAIASLGATAVFRSSKAGNRNAFFLLLTLAVTALGLAKAAPSLMASLAPGTPFERWGLAPLGISYFVFRLIQYGADRYRGTIPEASWSQLMAFLFFFPALPAGPIDTYQNFYGRRCVRWDAALAAAGARRLVLGYFKKLFLVNWLFDYALGDLTTGFLANPVLEVARSHPASPLFFVVAMFVYAFADLSAYTDIALGLGSLFGFRLSENFDRPFLRTNLADFWRSWHMSLSHWCRNQIYFPVFGLTRKPWAATYASMAVLGLWHHLSWNWIAWAGYHATGLVAYSQWRRFGPKVPGVAFQIVSIAFTLWFVSLGYAFVSSTNLRSAWSLFVACLTPWSGGVG